jgi:predicted nuclease of predicted toxin-antitoxin system
VTERIRFHLDENVDPDIALALRCQGIDVTTTVEVSLLGQNDQVQLSFGRQECRVIVTHDADFLRFASQSNDHCGIAFCQKDMRSIGDIIRSLALIYQLLTPEEMAGRVEYL